MPHRNKHIFKLKDAVNKLKTCELIFCLTFIKFNNHKALEDRDVPRIKSTKPKQLIKSTNQTLWASQINMSLSNQNTALLKRLTSSNYDLWLKQVKNLFQSHNILYLIDDPNNPSVKNKSADQGLGKTIITASLDTTAELYVLDCNTVQDMLSKLLDELPNIMSHIKQKINSQVLSLLTDATPFHFCSVL